MPRPPQFSAQAILDATAEIAAAVGPGATTIGSIAARLGAPTGSIYHRFVSRDALFAELWVQVVEAFQDGFVAELGRPDAGVAGLQAALYTPRWVRAHPVPARLVLLHHRDDFGGGDWPPEMAARAARAGAQMNHALRSFARRVLGSAGAVAVRRARFAVIDVPGAAVLPHLRAAEPPPAMLDELVRVAYLAIVEQG